MFNLRIQLIVIEKCSRSQIRWLQHADHILLTMAQVWYGTKMLKTSSRKSRWWCLQYKNKICFSLLLMRFEYNTSACDSSCLIFGRTVSACIRSISLAFRKQRPNQLRDPERGPLRFQRCWFFASLKASASNLKRCSPCQLFKFESHSYCKALPSNKHFHL